MKQFHKQNKRKQKCKTPKEMMPYTNANINPAYVIKLHRFELAD
jgi:hypothetical protein